MIVVIPELLSVQACQSARFALAKANFVDGKTTAGAGADLVKNLEQADCSTGLMSDLQRSVTRACLENTMFHLAARPKAIHVMFSRYQVGHYYGTHVDNVFMTAPITNVVATELMRRDISFTLFLSEPDTYEGGELVMDLPSGEQSFKPKAGTMVLYQTTPLHQVRKVTKGQRLAAIGWVRSYIRDAAQRELLMDLDVAQASLVDRHGESSESKLLAKSAMNLMRMWMED